MTADTTAARKLYFAACREVGLAEDVRRLMQERVTGKASTSAMGKGDFIKLMDELKERHGWKPKRHQPKRAGARTIAPGDQAAKIRALWLSLYHLGEVTDPAETAIDAYVRRVTKIDSLRFLDGAGADRVIKALRGWCDRVGYRLPDAMQRRAIDGWRAHAGLTLAPSGFAEKVILITAQWARLKALGAFDLPEAPLQNWLMRHAGVSAPHFIDPEQIDGLIERLGRWVRKAKEAK